MEKPKAAVVQMNSTKNVDENLKIVEMLIEEASKEGASLVVLPEMFP